MSAVAQRALLRAASVVIVLLLAWRMAAVGISQYYADQSQTDPQAVGAALAWRPNHPEALYRAGMASYAEDPRAAAQLWEQAFRANPADAGILARLARLWGERGDAQRAERGIHLAAQLAPMDPDVLLQSGASLVERGKLEDGLVHLGRALERRPSLKGELYPSLLQLAGDSQAYPALRALTDAPPKWWDDFMTYAAAKAETLKPLYAIAALRGTSPRPLSAIERDVFVDRLQREGLWGQAFMVWSENLPKERSAGLALLYNGGFELDISGRGYDWHNPPLKGVAVVADRSFGSRGERALHLTFSGRQGRFQNLYQPLYLQPGPYTVRGLVRLKELRTPKGLQWQLSCVGTAKPLGVSEVFFGTDEWRSFNFDFKVPTEACEGQVLRLVVLGKAASDFAFKGEAWFDDLAIKRGS